ncbi:DeoR/GlpR family DNA-binding transcription regulator [Pseudopelagicola sp. nBUS_19]|uniref:DeoR/GlpR family DNA-binding transcription regulator n=1 Tax=Pseudopelagicola sp. nBUS_19 TaxID=3395316 RepID=UPI003EBA1BF7
MPRTQLSSVLGVSEETIRRSIKSLSKSGAVARVHGGVFLVGTQSDPSFFRRIAENPEEKRFVAHELSQSIHDGMTLFLDVGSTTAFVAEELRLKSNLSIVTNSTRVAQSLVGHNNCRVFLLGGEMQPDELGAFGNVCERQARRYCFDVAVLSADALNTKSGFLYLNPAEASLASVVSECAEIKYVAMTHHKFETKAPHLGFSPSIVSTLFVDKKPRSKLSSALNGWGVKVQLAKKRDAQC